MEKTIAQQLGITDFPFIIKDKNGKTIYYELPDNTWWRKTKYDSNGNVTYSEDSNGRIIDNRPKETITVNGIKYQRIEQ